ncbi:tetratricopeptide repeat protein [Nocardiopsis sp. Huas11]|uniref:tetratricopeptide repeat protein n=1 Tax=Nocardiopsis sp. Huas11 TaxID=2183912 RepID=UPI0018F4E934|nr:tetratricopeptide repeat protein [Nocardiopsis sp. Huas11]
MPRSMVDLGRLERDQGRVEEARAWLEKAVGTGEPEAVDTAEDVLREMDGDAGP